MMAILLLKLTECIFKAFSARREKKNEENKIGNHDNPRVATRFGGEMVDAMNMQNMLLHSVPYTYMGEEIIGMSQQTVDPRGRKAGRKPHCSHCTVYKPLAELRETRTVQRGSFDGKDLSQCVYAFTRSLPSAETYLVVINVGSEDEHVDLSNWPTLEKDETWQVHTPSDNAQYSIGYSFETNGFTLRPKSAIVLCNKKELSSSSSSSSLPSKSIYPSPLVYPVAMLVVASCFVFANS